MSKEYYAEKYMLGFTNTKSLSKLNKLIEDNPNGLHKYVIAGYLYFSYKEFDHSKFQNLYNELTYFKLAIKKDDGSKNKYVDTYNSILMMAKQKEKQLEIKKSAITKINKQLREGVITLNALTKKLNLHYSNIYNALNKEAYTKVSIDDLMKLLKELRQNARN